MCFYRLKSWLKLSLACCLSFGVLFVVKMGNTLQLCKTQGERTFYLFTPSSQAVQTSALGLYDIGFVEGESVCFARPQGEALEIAKEIVLSYGGEIVCEEEACGVRCFYAFAPNLGGGVFVQGKRVNLHIAVSDAQCQVGTPLLFGGF
jgi:hypothetical protein